MDHVVKRGGELGRRVWELEGGELEGMGGEGDGM